MKIPDDLGQKINSLDELIEKVYPNINIQTYLRPIKWLQERAILAARNDDVDKINHKIIDSCHGDFKIYKSIVEQNI